LREGQITDLITRAIDGMTAIVAHQIRETLARPAPGQVLPGEFFLRDGTLR